MTFTPFICKMYHCAQCNMYNNDDVKALSLTPNRKLLLKQDKTVKNTF